MDQKKRQEIAAFRYQLIAGVVNRITPLALGEIQTYFREISQKEWTTSDGTSKRLSIRTLERYKQNYEQYGFEGLMPKSIEKRGTTALSPDVLEAAKQLRQARPDRSVEQIIYILEGNGVVEPGKTSVSTLGRYFRKEGLIRQSTRNDQNQNYGFRRFEADAPNRLWQADFHHTLYLPDPSDPKRRKKAKLCGILDDYSRFFVHAQYYWDEKIPALEDALKKAIEKHGTPEQFYCDNGSAFSSHHLKNICSRLGIRLSHSRPYKPQGRGKIERVFQFVDSSFKPESYEAIETGRIKTLEELNQAFSSWLNGFYHVRKHGSTKETPLQRLTAHPVIPLRYGKEELRRIFFLEEKRKADKTGCISLEGKNYEVPLRLAGQTVHVRFDPFDANDAEVYSGGHLVGKAKLLNAQENFRQSNVRQQLSKTTTANTIEGQMSLPMLDVAQKAYEENLVKEGLSFRGGHL